LGGLFGLLLGGLSSILGPIAALAAIVAGIVLPQLGAVPSNLVDAVGYQLAKALVGEIE
jgi:hypothetical protein